MGLNKKNPIDESKSAFIPESDTGKILVKLETGYRFIDKDDIKIIETEKNCSKVYLKDTEFIVKKPLAFFEKNLRSGNFLRANRNTIVNIDMIVEMKRTDNDYLIYLKNNNTINWGRKYRKELVRQFK